MTFLPTIKNISVNYVTVIKNAQSRNTNSLLVVALNGNCLYQKNIVVSWDSVMERLQKYQKYLKPKL